MGLAGAGKKAGGLIGRGIAEYAKEETKRQHRAMKDLMYLDRLSEKARQKELARREWQRDLEYTLCGATVEQYEKEMYPLISSLDLRNGGWGSNEG